MRYHRTFHQQSESGVSFDRYKIVPTLAFLLVAAAGTGTRMLIGKIYSAGSAVDLLTALTDSGLFIGSACLGGSATILALILTLTSVVRRDETNFSHDVYDEVRRVSRNATTALFTSIILLLALTVPSTEMNELPTGWYANLYNVLFGALVLTLATIASTIARLYLTISCIIGEWRSE